MLSLVRYQSISEISGLGNSSDALTYSVFTKEVDKPTLDTFLNNTPYESVLKNNLQREKLSTAFCELYRAEKLKSETFKVYLGNPTEVVNSRNVLQRLTYYKPIFVNIRV